MLKGRVAEGLIYTAREGPGPEAGAFCPWRLFPGGLSLSSRRAAVATPPQAPFPAPLE